MFSNIKISVRLITGFMLIVSISIVIGMIGISNSSKINDMADAMYAQDLLGLSHIKEANINLIYIGRARSNYLLSTSQEERQKHLASINKSTAAAKDNLDKAKPLFVTTRAKEIFAAFDKNWNEYQKDMQNAMTLAANEKLNQQSDALTQSLIKVRDTANELDDLLTELTKLKEERAKAASDETTELYNASRNQMITAIVVAAVLGLALGIMISRSVTIPLNKAKEAAIRLSEGDLSVKIDSTSRDETGQMMQAMQTMIAKLKQVIEGQKRVVEGANRGNFDARVELAGLQGFQKEMSEGLNQLVTTTGASIDDVVRVMGAMSEGDLTKKIDKSYEGAFGKLKDYANNTVEKLSTVVADVNSAADALASASEEVSATAQTLSQASSEQAAGVEETSASIEQMTASISQNTENAKVTDGMATKAAQEATEGGEAVKATVAAMNQIAKKIGIIDDIAYQTNLLALNAAIEAARAGEHGKGFAVVAAEVRKLAERSQVAAQEISEVATNSVELAEKAGKLLDEMVPSIKKTSDLVQEITAASKEQSSGVVQINAAVNQLSQTTQQNASSSEELAATAEEMSGQAEQLQHTMAFFKLHAGHVSHTAVTPKQPAPKPAFMKQNGTKMINGHALMATPDESHFVNF